MQLRVDIESWPYRVPFRVSRGAEAALEVIVVTLTDAQGVSGRGEAAGVDYDGETGESMAAALEGQRLALEACDPTQAAARVPTLSSPGARNALDCALWDLNAKRLGRRAWALAGFETLNPVVSAVTLGIDSEAATAEAAGRYHDWPLIKIKVNGVRHLEVIELVRRTCPTAEFIVDPNQAWNIELLNSLAGDLAALGVVLIEQPVPRGSDATLEAYSGAVPLAVDESLADRRDLERIAVFYDVANVKLDKCGGLTEALATAHAARALGLEVMVGCMAGTSLAMAPGMVVGQLARFIDLDGPLLHSSDRPAGIVYERGRMQVPRPELWG